MPRPRKNVDGYLDSQGRFHPIRGSTIGEDYDPEAVGEPYEYAPRRKTKQKTRRKNPPLPANKWVGAHAVKVVKRGGKIVRVDVMKEGGVRAKNPLRNIDAYVDEQGRIRPIRGSKGYRESKSQKVGRRVVGRGRKVGQAGWKYKKQKKGWFAIGPRGGKYGPFQTKKEAQASKG